MGRGDSKYWSRAFWRDTITSGGNPAAIAVVGGFPPSGGFLPTGGGETVGVAVGPEARITGGGIRNVTTFTWEAGRAGGKTRVKFCGPRRNISYTK